MNDKLETKKFVFTVEGDTEQWYLLWLRDQINQCENRKYNVLKADQLMKLFNDPDIKEIYDISGGDMANQILDYLDYDRIAES